MQRTIFAAHVTVCETNNHFHFTSSNKTLDSPTQRKSNPVEGKKWFRIKVLFTKDLALTRAIMVRTRTLSGDSWWRRWEKQPRNQPEVPDRWRSDQETSRKEKPVPFYLKMPSSEQMAISIRPSSRCTFPDSDCLQHCLQTGGAAPWRRYAGSPDKRRGHIHSCRLNTFKWRSKSVWWLYTNSISINMNTADEVGLGCRCTQQATHTSSILFWLPRWTARSISESSMAPQLQHANSVITLVHSHWWNGNIWQPEGSQWELVRLGDKGTRTVGVECVGSVSSVEHKWES